MMYKVIAHTVLCLWTFQATSQELIKVTTDDQETPVVSIVYIEGERLRPTNDLGELQVAEDECNNGAEVTAEPLEQLAEYIVPSTSGFCLGREEPVRIVVNRRLILRRAEAWAAFAIDQENWGLAAHALNEQYGLVRLSDPQSAEELKRQTLEVSARVVGVDPAASVRFDSVQETYVIDDEFRRALIEWKETRGVEGNRTMLDQDFFMRASERDSSEILYHSPTP